MTKAEYCPHCLQIVPVYPMKIDDGSIVSPCQNCGALFSPDWYRFVNQEQAIEIIETRKPLGKFVQDTGVEIVGIDNETGEAWTEEFPDLEECLAWLAGIEMREDE